MTLRVWPFAAAVAAMALGPQARGTATMSGAVVDASGTGITAPFSVPAQGPPPWHVYRIEPRSATVVLGAEPGGLTRFNF